MSRKIRTHARETTPAVRRDPESSAQREPARQTAPAQPLTQALSARPQSLAPADILALQQSVGNLATQQILGAMLGQSGVSTPVQTKLTLGGAGDRYEQEADRVAAEVTNAPARAQQPTIQRETDGEEGTLRTKPRVSRVESGGPSVAAPDLESAIGRARGDGQPLPVRLLERMEQGFGADFGGVRLHTDAEADALNRSVHARAFTAGQDMFFRRGEYNPDSREGQELIAHELTHVVQQGGGRVAGDNAPPEASGLVLQRKNLEQAKLAKGLTDDKNTLALVGDGRQAKTYSEVAPESENKLEALNKAGEMNAKIAGRYGHGNVWWTKGPEKDNFNKLTVNTLDPFFYRVHAPFKDGDKTESLGLCFQHALEFWGYVVWIKDSTSKAAANWVSMYKHGVKSLKTTDKFSDVHDITDSSKLIDLTGGGKEKHLDAYTKIAGEGARWQSVRKHAANLRNDSIFFTAETDEAYVKGIEFKNLWLTWSKVFNKKNDISDKELADAIWASPHFRTGGLYAGFIQTYSIDDLNKQDYDLDLGQSWVDYTRKIGPD